MMSNVLMARWNRVCKNGESTVSVHQLLSDNVVGDVRHGLIYPLASIGHEPALRVIKDRWPAFLVAHILAVVQRNNDRHILTWCAGR